MMEDIYTISYYCRLRAEYTTYYLLEMEYAEELPLMETSRSYTCVHCPECRTSTPSATTAD